MGDRKLGWAVIVALSGGEEATKKALDGKGWRTYLPMRKERRFGRRPRSIAKVRRNGEIVDVPALSGYLFAELHPDQEWSRLLECRGVIDVLTWQDGEREEPHLLSAAGIDRMRADENEGRYDDPRCRRGGSANRPDLAGAMKRGPVTVSGFAVGGHPMSGTLARLDAADRAIVEVMIFGRSVEVEVESAPLEIVA